MKLKPIPKIPAARWSGALRDLPVISIRQPFAWLVVNGIKDIENRSMRTHYRGQILIHASLSTANLYEEIKNELEQRGGVRMSMFAPATPPATCTTLHRRKGQDQRKVLGGPNFSVISTPYFTPTMAQNFPERNYTDQSGLDVHAIIDVAGSIRRNASEASTGIPVDEHVAVITNFYLNRPPAGQLDSARSLDWVKTHAFGKR